MVFQADFHPNQTFAIAVFWRFEAYWFLIIGVTILQERTEPTVVATRSIPSSNSL